MNPPRPLPGRVAARLARLGRRIGRALRSAPAAAVPRGRVSDRRPGWIDALECEANAMTAAPGAAPQDRRSP